MFLSARFRSSFAEIHVARLVLLQPDVRVAARLGSALGQLHEIIPAEAWESLDRVLVQSEAEGCCLDADHPTPLEAEVHIRRIRRAWPDLALIGFTGRTDLVEYHRLGLTGLESFVTDREGPMATRSAVDDALGRSRGRWAERALSSRVAAPFPALVGWSVARAMSNVTVEEMARAHGHTLGALRRELRASGLPGPARALLWGRLIAAGARIDRDGRGVEETAFALGYAAPNALARAMRAGVDIAPSELAQDGGAERVLEALVTRHTPHAQPREAGS